MKTPSVAAPIVNESPTEEKKFSAVVALVVSGLLVAILFAPTVRYPLYLSDDSPSIKTAVRLQEKMIAGDIFAPFRGNPGDRRYFPGFDFYQIIRYSILGDNSVVWHLFHMLMYTCIGWLTAWLGHRITKSIWPGLAAFGVMISTGEVDLSSNWMNFVSLPTFEPPLQFLWLSATFLLAASYRLRSFQLRWLIRIPALVLVAWSVIFKETAFIIVTPVLFAGLMLTLWYQKRTGKVNIYGLPIFLFVLIVCALGWGLHVYFKIPRDDAYGGMNSLNITPSSIWKAYQDYFKIIVGQSDYLIPLSFLLLALRLAGDRMIRESDLWIFGCLFAGFVQLSTLTIWPYHEGRLVQPAYLIFLLVAFCEIWFVLLRTHHIKIAGREQLLFAGGIIAFCGFLSFLLSPSVYNGTLIWLPVAFTAFGGAVIYHNAGLKKLGRLSVLAAFAIVGIVVVLQSINVRSFIFTEYDAREGARQKAFQHVAKVAPPNAKAYWIVNPDHEGHAWSTLFHAELFYNRADLVSGPANWVMSQGTPKKGDVLVNLTLNANLPVAGSGELTRLDMEDGGMVFALKTAKDIRRTLSQILTEGLSLEERQMFRLVYQGTRVPVYTVVSDTWMPGPELKPYFQQGQ